MAKAYQPPKAIINHPGVQECLSGVEGGAPDYAHDVRLRDGWIFTAGRMEGCQTGLFQSVERFRLARPLRIATLSLEVIAHLEARSGRTIFTGPRS